MHIFLTLLFVLQENSNETASKHLVKSNRNSYRQTQKISYFAYVLT